MNVSSGELRDGERTALRLARLYVAGDAWRTWAARAATAEDHAYADAKRARARAALRNVEAMFERELDAYLSTCSRTLPRLDGAEHARIVRAIWAVAEKRIPKSVAARRAAASLTTKTFRGPHVY